MKRLAGLLVTLGLQGAVACGSSAEVRAPAPAEPEPSGYERVPRVCQDAQQRPLDARHHAPQRIFSGATTPPDGPWDRPPRSSTVRILSVTPFLFEIALGG